MAKLIYKTKMIDKSMLREIPEHLFSGLKEEGRLSDEDLAKLHIQIWEEAMDKTISKMRRKGCVPEAIAYGIGSPSFSFREAVILFKCKVD